MTPEQEKLLAFALENPRRPLITHDAEVNYEVDRKIFPEDEMPPWIDAEPDLQKLYYEEVEAVKENVNCNNKALWDV